MKKTAKKARKAREWDILVDHHGVVRRLAEERHLVLLGAAEIIRVREVLPRKRAKAKRGKR